MLAYGRHGASGSFLQTTSSSEVTLDGVRFLTPTEVARLLCYPPLAFPDNITMKQRWKLLGNSVNVLVISHVLKDGLADYMSEIKQPLS